MIRKYRIIQPAPESSGQSSGEGGAGPWPQQSCVPKRTNVSQACENCRQAKAKCDGVHPVCHRCIKRDLVCSYSKDEQKQRDEAMKARLETLEQFFSTILTQSPEEVHRTVQSIKSSGGISDSSPSSNTLDWGQNSWMNSRDGAVGEDPGTTPTGAQEQRHPHNDAVFGLPDASVIAEAVAIFYDSSGPLFHVFTRAQALAFCARIYDPTTAQDCIDSMRADIACVAAIAAVGAQYMNGGIDGDLDARLYEISRASFETVLELRPFDAIKISALLAMFNIMTKATTAITYVEIGLSMARMQGVMLPIDYNIPVLAACKTAWRTLMFFSCWLSSTLGYVSGNDVWFGKLPISSFNAENPSDMHEVVQAEMTKISMLKARVLQLQMNFQGQPILSLESMMKELQDWYDALPEPLRLASLVQQGNSLPDPVWVSICHTHLLFLGAIMLLHRRTMFQCMEAHVTRIEDHSMLLPDRKLLIDRSSDGLAAAKHSATILNLLMQRGTLFKRCWLVIFQSYTSCTSIFHAVSQKQMHNFPKSDWSADLEQGQLCLSVLEFCGGLDPVAYRFRERLATIYTKLAGYEPTGGDSLMFEQDLSNRYLFAVPEGASDDQKAASWTLLNLLCKPFTEPADKVDSEEDVRKNFAECPLRRYNSFYTQLMEQLQWKYESTQPFNWDVHSLVGCEIGGVNNEEQGHRFLGSAQPNFWRSGPGVMRPD